MSKTQPPADFHHGDDPEMALKLMHRVSSSFYTMAAMCGVHTLIEFTGFINEYIKLCEDAHKAGIDFIHANAHGGDENPLPMETYHAEYIAEKFNCIFGPSLRANPNAMATFIRKLQSGH